MWETAQFWGTIDFHSIYIILLWSQWCPKTVWLQTSEYLFVRQNKEIHTGLELLEGE